MRVYLPSKRQMAYLIGLLRAYDYQEAIDLIEKLQKGAQRAIEEN